MILKMNFNFNLKDILPRQTRQSAASQPHVIGITLRNSALEVQRSAWNGLSLGGRGLSAE